MPCSLPLPEKLFRNGPHHVPLYHSWQPGWDAYRFDHRHVILGRVAKFAPYRLTVARRDGVVQPIDLKKGTVILPTGATPTANTTSCRDRIL